MDAAMGGTARHDIFPTPRPRPWFRGAMIPCLMIVIFATDTITDYEIALSVFYIAAILIAIDFLPTRGVVALACACVGLTLVSLSLTPSGAFKAGLINCSISISAIGITTYLALKMVAAKAAIYEAQAQLARMARLTSLGELTASIAHEVNQPLAAIATSGGACLRWLDQEPPNLDRARRAAERIIGDANRASEVIMRIRGLARGETPRKEPLAINETITEAIALARGEIDRNGIALRMALAEDLPPVLADRIQIQQVIGNLLLNAVEAMAGVPSPKRMLDISSFREGEERVVFAVADSGAGLQPAALEHLFDAFWTTKEGGTGIGLTISRSIIEAHGGRIWVTSKPRMGAVFRFSLPIAGGNAA